MSTYRVPESERGNRQPKQPVTRDVDIPVNAKMVERYGLHAAYFMKQIDYIARYEEKADDGWCTASHFHISEMTGVKPEAVRKMLVKLAGEGLIQVRERVADNGRRLSNAYRVLVDRVGNPIEPDDSGYPEEWPGTFPEEVPDLHRSKSGRSNTPYSPPSGDEEEGASPKARRKPRRSTQPSSLFDADPSTAGCDDVAAQRSPDMIDAWFDLWWSEHYPQLDGATMGGRGSKATARRAYRNALHGGRKGNKRKFTQAELADRADNYRMTRKLYAAHYGTEPPALLNASTFLNGRHEDFVEVVQPEEAANLWPTPKDAGSDDAPFESVIDRALGVSR